MRLALLTDIHGNREALDACRSEARRLGADKFVYLGDFVGYGADPAYVVARIAEDFNKGAIGVIGNHDLAVIDPNARQMYDAARRAIEYADAQLDAAQKTFLADLPYVASLGDLLFVHAEARAPEKFDYVETAEDAADSMEATRARVTFCGHIHRPRLFYRSVVGRAVAFTPGLAPTPMVLARSRRWLATLGSVGQPRDGDPRAAFALFETDSATLTFHRVDYDIDTAARKIRDAGLSELFADRLFVGR